MLKQKGGGQAAPWEKILKRKRFQMSKEMVKPFHRRSVCNPKTVTDGIPSPVDVYY